MRMFGRRRVVGEPLATWPGVRLGRWQVLVEWDEKGPRVVRDHGQPQVGCLWPWEDPAESVGHWAWEQRALADVVQHVDRLPSEPDRGWQVGVGRGWQVTVTARDLGRLTEAAMGADLREVDASSLGTAEWSRWGVPPAEATGALGEHALLRGSHRGRDCYAVVVGSPDAAESETFRALMSRHRVRDPIQLWSGDDVGGLA